MFKSLKALALVCVLLLGSSVALAGDTMGPPAPEQPSTSTSVITSVVTTLILLVVK
jgi:hypothetical protein